MPVQKNAQQIKVESLYNKYRPKTFSDIVGQVVPVSVMRNAIMTGKVANCYLMSGQRGVGKTSAGRIFAKALLCNDHNREEPDGCGVCDSCRSFEAEGAADFIEMDAASNRGIDNIRSLIQNVQIAPRVSTKRVVLIDEIHHLTSDASTALLKVLEEPPAGTVFLLATTEPQKMLPTIRSRCQWLRFKPLTPTQVTDRVSQILYHEGITAEEGVAMLIARQSKGGLRDALSMLDMLIAYAGASGTIHLAEAERCLGAVEHGLLESLCRGFIANDLPAMLSFTVRNPGDAAPKEIMIGFSDILSDALLLQQCSPEMLGDFGMASRVLSAEVAREMLPEKIMYILDTIQRNLWKFDADGLDDSHVFNEIIMMCFDKKLNPMQPDSTDLLFVKQKVSTMSKAISVLVDLQKKLLAK